MTFNTNESMRPLTANITRFQDQYGIRWNFIMAYGMILATPVTLAFIFLQKYIIGGLTQGAIKE
jgi:multiple sugar transport system permease protein